MSLPPHLSLLLPAGAVGHGYACGFSLERTDSGHGRWSTRWGAEWEKLVGNITKIIGEAVPVAQDADSRSVGR